MRAWPLLSACYCLLYTPGRGASTPTSSLWESSCTSSAKVGREGGGGWGGEGGGEGGGHRKGGGTGRGMQDQGAQEGGCRTGDRLLNGERTELLIPTQKLRIQDPKFACLHPAGVQYIQSGGSCLPLPFGPCPATGVRSPLRGAGRGRGDRTSGSWFQVSAYAIRIRLGRITWYDASVPKPFRELVTGLLKAEPSERWTMQQVRGGGGGQGLVASGMGCRSGTTGMGHGCGPCCDPLYRPPTHSRQALTPALPCPLSSRCSRAMP